MASHITTIMNNKPSGLHLFMLANTPFLLFHLYRSIYPIQIPKTKNILSETDEYIEQYKIKFQKVCEKYIESKKTFLNDNMSSDFYSKKEYQTTISCEDNQLEIEWKRRILFENTPRGNIIMFYDPYKLAFTYYCDTSSMPYSVLNAVAMKYVMNFHCIDLFVDNEYASDKIGSPLIKTLFTEEKKEKTKEEKKNGIDMKNAPFAKLKKGTNQPPSIKDKNVEPEIIYHRNKFVCIGKIVNFSFIHKMKHTENHINGFHSNLLNNLAAETTLQKQVLSYKDFKNRETN